MTTAHHGELTCRAVVLATDARSAAELLPGLRVPDFHPVTVLHHATDEPPLTEPALLLDADRSGPVSHTAVISQVDPSRAPAGRALITSTVLGTPPDPAHLDATVRAQLARLYRTSTTRWELLAAHHVPEAVPAMPAPTTCGARYASWPASTCAATTATPAPSRVPSTPPAEPPTPS